ncbi:uncharacterized protein [Drosophila suzukii]|uniref:Uncharacterized protein n=1 Tax=Drosophila suzukii TaxID=28584 RepID=A0ABM4TVU5_DROSZ
MIEETFGFVQFESERQANIAILALHQSRFKAKTLTVHSATSQSMEEHGHDSRQFGEDVLVAEADSSGQDLIADCEIIAMDLQGFRGAMRIRDRLIAKGLCTEVRSPIAMDDNEPLSSLEELAALGTQYAIVLTSVNESMGSASVHYLYEDRSEHPDLPQDQAIEMVESDFNLRHVFNSADGVRDCGC